MITFDWESYSNIRYIVKLISEAPIETEEKLSLIVKLVFETTSDKTYQENVAYIVKFFEEHAPETGEEEIQKEDQQKIEAIRSTLQKLITTS